MDLRMEPTRWWYLLRAQNLGLVLYECVPHIPPSGTPVGNMKDNRVLNSRPPSINDEETLLQRRQRTTLSQLRSGHCKLLNSYKKRLKQSDSSRCPDCGMDPQDVPRLLDCVAHPNDLSPVNLWDKPIETIREFSFLDPVNLN